MPVSIADWLSPTEGRSHAVCCLRSGPEPAREQDSLHRGRRAAGARALLPARRPALAGELGRGGRRGGRDPARLARLQMPLEMAGWSFVHGMVFGLLPIGWTVFAAMLLYNITVETGQFTIIRRSIGDLSAATPACRRC